MMVWRDAPMENCHTKIERCTNVDVCMWVCVYALVCIYIYVYIYVRAELGTNDHLNWALLPLYSAKLLKCEIII